MSRTIDILNAKKTGVEYTEDAYSRSETILKAICNSTSVDLIPQSRYEELLLAIKNGETTSITPKTRLEELLSAIANGTLDEYIAGKNLFDESAFPSREIVDNKKCLAFNGFFAATTGTKVGNPLLIASDLPAGTYSVKGKLKKTDNFNALAGMNESNVRTAFGTFKDNFTEDTITFTTTEKLKYLYIDTGSASADGYCEIETLMFGKNLSNQYSPYFFTSEIETAFYEAFGAD